MSCTSPLFKADIATRKRRYRLPRRPTAAVPGTTEKVRVMEQRLERGEHIHHPLDVQMDAEGYVRAPVLDPGNHKLKGWQLLTEREYRALRPADPWWPHDDDDDGVRQLTFSEVFDIRRPPTLRDADLDDAILDDDSEADELAADVAALAGHIDLDHIDLDPDNE
jgi:hypothetical protein